jgi:PAS domain S-box-containing protein
MVEDNPGDRLLLSELLGASGISIQQIHHANDLKAAIDLLHQYNVDIILLDLSLPDSSGIDSFGSMRTAAPNIPIVILSGLADMNVALDAINLGAQDYLIKGDFDERMLEKTILYSIERIRSLKQVRESNERFNLVSMATNDMVWDWDLETGIVYRNKEGWKKIFKTEPGEEETGAPDDWQERIHPEDREKAASINQVLKSRGNTNFFEVECRVRRDDGSYAFIHDRANIIRNESGEAVRVIGAAEDITGRKLAELQVVKSELRFRSLVQNGSDLISILDVEGNYLYSSPAIKRILGYESEFMIGKNAFAFIHPDDSKTIMKYLGNRKKDQHFEVQAFRFRNVDGNWRWLESKITDMTGNNDIQGYIFNSRDVTERKNAEVEIKKLSFIAQETVNVVIITDTMGSTIWVNDAFTRVTEFAFEEVVGKKPGDLLQGPESSQDVIAYMRENIKNIKPFDCDIINYTKSGRKYWIRIQCQPQFDEAGVHQYFFCLQTDITKVKEAEKVLKASEERYRYLFNNNPASIFIWDMNNFRILEVNDTATTLYGYNQQEFLSKDMLELRLPDDENKLREFASMAAQGDDFNSVNVWKHLNKSGDTMYMNIGSHRIQYKGRTAILAMATNITDKIYLERILEEERLVKQQEITDAVISAQENERQDLGRELHDNINQILASSRLYLGMAKAKSKATIPYIDETETLICSAINEIRTLSHSLIPPSLVESELLGALDNIISTTRKNSGLHITLQALRFDEDIIPDKLKLTIYRIVQEQFNNILKYADAQNVTVQLVQDEQNLTLSIKDDGAGFDTSKKVSGIGLLNIKTRASLFNGEMMIISSPGNGCELRIFFS